jgi:signal transduction histidine kinase
MSRSQSKVPLISADLVRSLPLGDLLSIGTQFTGDLSPENLLREIVEVIHQTLGFPQVYVRLRDADTDVLLAHAFAGVSPELEARLRERPTAPALYQALLHPQYRLSESFLIPPSCNEEFDAEPGIAEQRALAKHGRSTPGLLLVPLRGRSDRLLGVIYVAAANEQSFSQPNIQILEAIARQAALGVENVRLADRTARLLAKEQLLAELGRDVTTTLDLETILERTVARLEVAFHGQGGSIILLDENNELEIVAGSERVDAEARSVRLKYGEGIAGWVVEHGRPYLSSDIDAETVVRPAARSLGSNKHIRSYISVPLRTGGSVIGTLNVEHPQPNAFSFEDVDLLEAIAAQIGGPISSAQLYERSQRLAAQVQRRAEQLMVLNGIARTATATLDLDHALNKITDQIREGFGYQHVELLLLNDDGNQLELAAQSGGRRILPTDYTQHAQAGLMGRTVRTGLTQLVDDVREDPDFIELSLLETRSELCVPVIVGGRVLGVLNLESPNPGAYSDEDVSVLETTADVLAGAIENARLYRRAQEAAVLEERNRLARDLHDSVTQQLFSMTLTAQAARAQLGKNIQRAGAQLERIQETATAALAEMRALIFQLRPPALSDQGLVAALNQHIGALSRREAIRAEMSVAGDERHARGTEQAIYRIVQEALNNVVKHANASAVSVSLEFTPELVRVSVADNGVGFDIQSVNKGQTNSGRHLGLISMRERAAELGGTMELHTAPGGGTEIVVLVPRSERTTRQ